MDFRFTEDQLMMAETARKLLADTATSAQLRTMLANGMARDDARWTKIVETGLTLTMLPEDAGGLGLTEADFVLIAEAAGYAALPEPLVESAGIAAPLLAAIAPAHEVLGDPAATIAIGHAINPYVADADTAAALLLHHDGATYLRRPDEVRLIREESLDPFRRLFKVEWEPSGEPLSAAPDLWSDALDRGALFMAAQCAGLAQRAIDIAVDYAKTREQFGKPIGAYQAVKHLLATAQVQVEFAKPVVHAAAIGLAQRDVFSRARISHAKIVAAEAADLATRTALQVHGAMGYSWEVDVHFLLKRALALNTAWGGPGFHRERVLARLRAAPAGPEYGFAHAGMEA
ncbi:acyl-CoA dehydrogenase family protein [Acidocella sp. KAb 2-4]|uniref:acyl-CoA dehydrogenase family protein n=1 Tax=Acidocella sp. KAb 2-4 TaxID=2885158 RepID=UPI001D05CA1A|nr:acyl-CoA dehydrogenase family protein [Acidocella sp. KAb 2-4]MCB5944351.1 acyl-CoA dehydrogenase family protein [Acidocella sp. KAb 2-4]